MEKGEDFHKEYHEEGKKQGSTSQEQDEEDFYPAPNKNSKNDNFDATKTHSSIRSGGSKHGSHIAYSEMSEKVAVKSTRKKVIFQFW